MAAPRLSGYVEAFLSQSAALADWLDGLDPDDFARPAVLTGWDLRTLLGHIVLVGNGLERSLSTPTAEPALPVHEYVRRYRPDVEQIARNTLDVTGANTPGELLARLRDADPIRAAATGVDDRATLLGGRGPIRAVDCLATRIVELVVHCDDFSRSLPEREPVPLRRDALAVAVRTLAEILAGQAPGRSVELRVPPYVAVQAVEGPRHTRGTPPNVVEVDPVAWLRLATGRLDFTTALAAGVVRAGGQRSDLSPYLPVLS